MPKGKPSWVVRGGGNPDKNQAEIIDVWRRFGADVTVTSQVGRNFPDLVVGLSGVTLLCEVTNPEGKGKAHRERKQRQADFRANWKGGPVLEVKTGQDVVDFVQGHQWRRILHDDAAAGIPARKADTAR